MALGAFIAGVLLADSEYRHELEADIEPFKGLLLGLFFIAVGMSANLGLLVESPLLVAGLTVAFLTVKTTLVWAAARLARHSQATAWRLGVALAGGGEFAFVLFALATRNGLLESRTSDLLVLVVTASMALSPLLMALADRIARHYAPPAPEPVFDRIEPQEPRVLIAGFGRVGQIVGRVLRARRIPFTALETSPAQVDFLRRFGNKLYYGDASRLEMLRSAGADHADVLVLAIDDVEASVRTAELVQRHFPEAAHHRPRPQSPAHVSPDGSGCEGNPPRDAGVEPGDGRADARCAGHCNQHRRGAGAAIPRARRPDVAQAGADQGR